MQVGAFRFYELATSSDSDVMLPNLTKCLFERLVCFKRFSKSFMQCDFQLWRRSKSIYVENRINEELDEVSGRRPSLEVPIDQLLVTVAVSGAHFHTRNSGQEIW